MTMRMLYLDFRATADHSVRSSIPSPRPTASNQDRRARSSTRRLAVRSGCRPLPTTTTSSIPDRPAARADSMRAFNLKDIRTHRLASFSSCQRLSQGWCSSPRCPSPSLTCESKFSFIYFILFTSVLIWMMFQFLRRRGPGQQMRRWRNRSKM